MEVNLLVIHCSATAPNLDVGADQIREWHKAKGWLDIGYHYVICRSGIIEGGRDLDGDGDTEDNMGAHAAGFNKNSLSICMVGGVDTKGNPDCNFTRNQWRSLENLVRDIADRHGLNHKQIVGHRDIPEVNKDCPCFDVQAWINRSIY